MVCGPLSWPRPDGTNSWSSTSFCPAWTGSPSCDGSPGRVPRSRCWCCRPCPTSNHGSPRSNWERWISSRNRSPWPSCWPGSACGSANGWGRAQPGSSPSAPSRWISCAAWSRSMGVPPWASPSGSSCSCNASCAGTTRCAPGRSFFPTCGATRSTREATSSTSTWDVYGRNSAARGSRPFAMSAIASWLRKLWPETAWALFSLANVLVIFSLSEWETVPFHFIWVSLTILYGFRVWGVRTTTVVLSLVMAVTGVALIWSIEHSNQAPDELTEVPLMAAMFVAMVWHARRHQAATEEVRRLAESERRLRERERHFVRNASHELRTPITVARGHAELIRTASEGDEVIKDVEVVLDELKRLSRISERLLIIAAAEHQGLLHLRPVDLGELIATTANRWTATADRAWRLSVLADGTMPADQERLE